MASKAGPSAKEIESEIVGGASAALV